MNPRIFFSAAKIILCLVIATSQAYAEVKIESVSQTTGVVGKDMEVTLTGSGFTPNTKVVMMPDYANKKKIVGSVSRTPTNNVAIVGDKAYVTWGTYRNSGLSIIDVSDPALPKTIGSFGSDQGFVIGPWQDIAVSGNYAYVAAEAGGFKIVDISKPENPKLAGEDIYNGRANSVCTFGEYVFVGCESWINTYYVGNPESPKIVGQKIDNTAKKMFVSGNHLYTTDGGLFVSGNYVYVVGGSLTVIDVGNPENPKIIGSSSVSAKVYTSGTLADYEKGLLIFDVGNPGNPVLVGQGADTPGYSTGVCVSGKYAYVTWNGGLRVFDVSKPETPVLTGQGFYTPGAASNVIVSGNYAYVADLLGLRIIDVSRPDIIENIGQRVAVPNVANAVTVSGNYAYVSESAYTGDAETYGFKSGLRIIDVSKPEKPQMIGQGVDISAGGGAAISVSGNHVYMALYHSGFQIIDVGKPESARIIGQVSFDSPSALVYDVYVSGNYAYTGGDCGYMNIIDISKPESSKIIGQSGDITGWLQGVFVSGNYAYVTYSGNYAVYYEPPCRDGLRIIDISNPENPESVGRACSGFGTSDVYVSGNYAYVTYDGGLQIIDISKPENPEIIGQSIATPGHINGVYVSENYAYVADGIEGLQIIDVGNPANPRIIGQGIATPGLAYGVFVSGGYVYVADGYDGLRILQTPSDIRSVALRSDRQLSVILPAPPTAGVYSLFAYNTDTDENVFEFPGAITFTDKPDVPNIKPDAYEDDDTSDKAKAVVPNDEMPQHHTFHKSGDTDWVRFDATTDQKAVNIRVSNMGESCDPVIEVFRSENMSVPLTCESLQNIGDYHKILSCGIPAPGTYLVKLKNSDKDSFGETVGYDLEVYDPTSCISVANPQIAVSEPQPAGTDTFTINKGESVLFSGLVSGDPTAMNYYGYSWNFGGGAPDSDKKDPGYVVFGKPDTPGSTDFQVVFSVKDDRGCVSKSQPITVRVNYTEPKPADPPVVVNPQPDPAESDSGGGGCFIRSVF